MAALLLGSVVYTAGELLGGPVHGALSAEAAPEHLRGRYLSLIQLAWNVAGVLAPVSFAWLLDRGAWPIWVALARSPWSGGCWRCRLGSVLPRAGDRVTNARRSRSRPEAAAPGWDWPLGRPCATRSRACASEC